MGMTSTLVALSVAILFFSVAAVPSRELLSTDEAAPTGDTVERVAMVDEMKKVSGALRTKLDKEKAAEILADKQAYDRMMAAKKAMEEADVINQKAKSAWEVARDAHEAALSTLRKLEASLKVALLNFDSVMAYIGAERKTCVEEEKVIKQATFLVDLVHRTTHDEATRWYTLHPEYRPDDVSEADVRNAESKAEEEAAAAKVPGLTLDLQNPEADDPILAWIGQNGATADEVRANVGALAGALAERVAGLDSLEEEEKARVQKLRLLVAEWTIKEKNLLAVRQEKKAEYDRTQRLYDEAVGRYEAEKQSYELSHAEFLKKMDLIRREVEVLGKLEAKLDVYEGTQQRKITVPEA